MEFYLAINFNLNQRSSNVLSYVYWTSFCYTLIDLLACVPYYSMHVLNKHEGLSKKKKKNFETFCQEVLKSLFFWTLPSVEAEQPIALLY